ncbi:MAG: adenine nucleotide alpha hydrolase [Ignavibacteria bacterium]|nr:adenine nucleotide alpha hydrolase [Ignavibacteria bacterium]
MTERVLFSWSGGKDSTMALYEIIKTKAYHVAALITTVTERYDRISMHGVRNALLERQASMLNLPLEKIWIPTGASNDTYKERMLEGLYKYRTAGISSVAFGDLFLQDIKRYREELLATVQMKAIFPIWKRDTRVMAADFIGSGFKAVVICTDPKVLDKSFTGRMFDESFLSDLPSSIDPCGENGEFHTFVYGGPIFKQEIPLRIGDVVFRDGFHFCDLLPLELVS